MFTTQVQRQFRYQFRRTVEHSQLLVLRRVITVNRTLHQARRWLQPVWSWMWLPPASFLIGMVGVMLLRLG